MEASINNLAETISKRVNGTKATEIFKNWVKENYESFKIEDQNSLSRNELDQICDLAEQVGVL